MSFGDVLRTGWIGAWKAMGTSCWCFLREGGPLRCEFVCPSLGLATEISPALPYGHVLPLWYAAALTCFDAEVSLEGRVKKFLHVTSHFILKCLSSRKLPFFLYPVMFQCVLHTLWTLLLQNPVPPFYRRGTLSPRLIRAVNNIVCGHTTQSCGARLQYGLA